MARNLVNHGRMSTERAAHLMSTMQRAFVSATVPRPAIARIEPLMTNHPKDRHVLAMASAAAAPIIVTANLKDFPASACDPVGVRVVHPDDFLLHHLVENPREVTRILREQAERLRTPPIPYADVLSALSRDAPRFVEYVEKIDT